MKDNVFWLLLIFSSLYILGNIGTGSLSTWDEAIYANVSREMLNMGNWLVLHYQGEPWFDKPPLYMWMTALFYKVFGVNEFSVRLTSGLFGIATVLLVYIFSKKISNKNTAILAALILLATPHFIHFSKLGMMDVPLAFFIVLMVYFFWRGQEKPHYLFFSGLFFALGYFTKGFAAFLGLFIIVGYCIFSKKARYLFKLQFMAGLLFVFIIIFLWHYIQYFLAGPDAIKNYFGFHIYKRATQPLDCHIGGINFYQKAIFNKNKPWSVLMYISIFYILWQALRYKDKRAILICCWVLAAYILYTAVKTKLHWYIIPIYPALALSSAVFLERFFKYRAFNLALTIILLGMLAQVPASWAFKLDYTPQVKKVANIAKEFWENGNDIYIIGASHTEMFYCDFATHFERDIYNKLISAGTQQIYCIVLPEYMKESSIKYNFDYEPIYESNRLSFYKIRFKK